MTRLTDGKKTVEIEMKKWNGSGYDPDWSEDFFEVGQVPYDEEKEAYIVKDVDYCIEQARACVEEDNENLKESEYYDGEEEFFLFVDEV